ncbi:unnamed protein product [Cercospora beticola]|nr:unnamed protein product [Cercospora beticola]
MRLLNINTLEFKVFPTEQDRPPYVITSHRWSNDEITFQQFLAHKSDPSICQMRGFQKIQSFCKFVKDWATGVGIDWIWIDTCCIDKTSSSELQEAINSMFRWYSDALVCLAYLKDVQSLDTSPAEVMNDFEQSIWFKRGWTLQELLAPSLVVFLSNNWEVLGHKASTPVRVNEPAKRLRPFSAREIRFPLNQWIARAANIPEDIIADYKKSANLSISQKRSGLDNRNTTRPEDSAYCLLGICGIYLPLIYGEREQAFERLEEAIERRNLRTNAQTPDKSTSQSPNATADQSEIDSSDGEHSEATVNWHEIANKHKDQGNKYYKSGQYEAAIQEYTHAVKTDPRSHIHFGNRAAAFMMMTWYREAIDDCNRALELDPGNRKITERLEKAKAALGQQLGGRPNVDNQESLRHALHPVNSPVLADALRAPSARRSGEVSRTRPSAGAARRATSVDATRALQNPVTKPNVGTERGHSTGSGNLRPLRPEDIRIRAGYGSLPQKDKSRSSQNALLHWALGNPRVPRPN